MIIKPIQARAVFLFSAFVSAIFLFPGEISGAQINMDSGARNKESRQEEVLPLGDLLPNAEDILPSWLYSRDDTFPVQKEKTAEKNAEKNMKQGGNSDGESKEKEAADKKQNDVPVTKTPDPAPASREKPEPAYRVYPSPYVPDETPSYPAMEFPAKTYESEMYGKEPLPPLRPLILARTGGNTSGFPVPPVAGLVRQYFPVLPFGAANDASPQYIPLASNHDLLDDHSGAYRAIVFIHDISRNASESLAMLTTMAGTENETTLMLAPQFLLEIDITRFLPWLPEQGRNIARWAANHGSGWQTGEDSVARPPQKGISSFTAVDFILMFLSDRERFPNLKQIVIAGHGMGADFVQRYAAVGNAPSLLAKQGLPVHFLAANASSYLYFTRVRPGAGTGVFGLAEAPNCPSANDYPYGLGKLIPYARRAGGDTIRLRFPERRITYLLSEKISGDPYIDTGCEAMAQGKDRLSRGRNYERYLMMSFGDDARKTQSFAVVPNADYDPVSLLGSYCGMAVLFGDGRCTKENMAQ